MENIVSIEDFKIDAAHFKNFFLAFSEPQNTLKAFMVFEKAVVNIYDYPYVVLKNQFGEITVRHIMSISKKFDGKTSTYTFICNNYTNKKHPTQDEIILKCI